MSTFIQMSTIRKLRERWILLIDGKTLLTHDVAISNSSERRSAVPGEISALLFAIRMKMDGGQV
jgi:hypothetical protein